MGSLTKLITQAFVSHNYKEYYVKCSSPWYQASPQLPPPLNCSLVSLGIALALRAPYGRNLRLIFSVTYDLGFLAIFSLFAMFCYLPGQLAWVTKDRLINWQSVRCKPLSPRSAQRYLS